MVPEPSEEDLEKLPPKLERHREFFSNLLNEVEPTPLSQVHQQFLRVLGVTGDADRAYRRLLNATGANNGKDIILGSVWGYRHPPAISITPSERLFSELHGSIRRTPGFDDDAPITVLDFMAGGGTIPLEAVRYGCKVFANELNPVAALVIKATKESRDGQKSSKEHSGTNIIPMSGKSSWGVCHHFIIAKPDCCFSKGWQKAILKRHARLLIHWTEGLSEAGCQSCQSADTGAAEDRSIITMTDYPLTPK
jgi:hypothetical protein